MKLLTFTHDGRTRVGRLTADGKAVADLSAESRLPTDMAALLEAGDPALEIAHAASCPELPLADVTLRPPILRPAKFLGIGMNYAAHLAEAGRERPQHQVWFAKHATSMTGPYDPIVLPAASRALDYECELGVVIGRRCRHVSISDAPSVVAGYTICNDGSIRDWQFRSPTVMLGKAFDRTSPVGPWIVTPDELGDPHDLGLKTWVNGELRQDARTSQMLFNCWEMIAELSTAFTLEAGDVLATGSPAGVGAAMKPPQFLKAGDRVRMEIEKIGAIENLVEAEATVSAHAR